jgi:hypothetical protein
MSQTRTPRAPGESHTDSNVRRDPLAMGIVEVMQEVFYITTSEIYTWSASHLYRLDLNRWTPGKPVHPEPILHFAEPVRGLNGSCVVAPGLILLADCFSSSISCGSQHA